MVDPSMIVGAAEYAIRPARPEDADPIAQIHVATWKQTYKDLIPPQAMVAANLAHRLEMWRGLLTIESLDKGYCAFVAESHAHALSGFVLVGPQRSKRPEFEPYPGEIMALYVMKDAQRRGLGRRLLSAGANELLAMGLDRASAWILSANANARGFYERMGGREIATQTETRHGGVPLEEVAYGLDDLGAIVASTRG
jgi:ribosomal protein S18 acetylase RimI-like enzyme